MNKTTKALLLATSAFAGVTMAIAGTDASADMIGTDVSSHQGLINYKANGFDFALVKATEGTGYVNPYLTAQSVQAEKEGILQGAYHYYRTGAHGTPEQQAQFFINSVGAKYAKDPNTILMLDIESNPGVDNNIFTGNEPKRFLDEVYRLTKKKALVYMNLAYATGNNGQFDWSDIADYPLMLAIFPSMNNSVFYKEWTEQQINKVRWFKHVPIVQFGDGGGFDRDYLYGTRESILEAQNGKKVAPVKPKPSNPKPAPVKEKYATFNDVYVVDSWKVFNGKYYGLNFSMGINPLDYNNYIPVAPITLTDRYGHELKNQTIQGNNGNLEFFILKGKYKVLEQKGKYVKLQIGGEPVWMLSKFATIK